MVAPLLCRNFAVELHCVPAYTFNAVDNGHRYDQVYHLNDEVVQPSTLHTVRVISRTDDRVTTTCILTASGGTTGIHENSAVVHDDSLVIAVGPFIVSLQLPSLEINWKTQTDQATCFGIYHSSKHRCYLSHGELEIARLSYQGKVEWTHGGADIYANKFTLSENRVEAIDWNNDAYVWDIATGRAV